MKERFHYKKSMGQHFLLDPVVNARLADASGVTKEDGVLEIGPGRGTLTVELARRARKVICVELDRTLLDDLDVLLALYPNAELVQGDILREDIAALVARLGTPCRVAANLPYNITTPLLSKLLLAKLPFLSYAVMLQKEVGERMLAGPGHEGYGPLSILVQYFTEPKLAMEVPAALFTPPPKVDSCFMLLTARQVPPVPVSDEALFFRVVRAAFAMRRKTMLNNIAAGFAIARAQAEEILIRAGIAPEARGEQLALADFARLAEVIGAARGQ